MTRSRSISLLAAALAVALAGCDDDHGRGGHGPVAAAPGQVLNFGASPLTDCPNPEGIAVDGDGKIWTGSAPGAGGGSATTAHICKLSRSGRVFDVFTVGAGASGAVNIGGLLFAPGDGLYFTDFGDFGPAANKRLLRLDLASLVIAPVASDFVSPNAIARDGAGNLYVSDSAQGAVFRIAADATRTKTLWKQDPLLATDNTNLPFGANGLAFDDAHAFLYVANTGESTILRIAVNPDGSAGDAALFADGATLGGNALAGADGIVYRAGDLYVCANQANEIQVLSTVGTPAITARYAGTGAHAFVFPASLAFRGDQAYVANLSFGAAGGKLSVVGIPANP